MTAVALRTGQLLNQSEIARDIALSQPTVHRYLNLLETAQVGQRLPAYATSRTTRLVKSPKFYWADAALAAHLAGYYDAESVANAKESGHLFENLVLHHLRALAAQMIPTAALFHWRTAGKTEVDFIAEWGRKLIAVEVKLTDRPRHSDCRGLERFLAQHEQAVCGLLVHAGRSIELLGNRIAAVPWEYMARGTMAADGERGE
jgi:predicted AAA+ superfamily ATPase